MTDTNISDAIVFPEDEGTGVVDEKADRASAGHAGLLAQHVQGGYVDKGCAFANVDTTNEQVDITAGHTFIELDSVSIQSGSQATYDTTLPNPIVLCVVLPTDVVDLGLDTDATNDIWLAVDATTNDGAYLRYGSGLSAPADPSVKLGTVDTASGSTTRASDDVPLSNNVDAGGKNIRNVGSLGAEKEAITGNVVRAYFDETQGTYEDYDINDYADIFDAANQARTDGAQTIVYPGNGTYSATTTLRVVGRSSHISPGRGGLTVDWQGGAGSKAIAFGDGQQGLNHFEFSGISLRGNGSGTPFELDPTNSCKIGHIHNFDIEGTWGAPVKALGGTSFQLRFSDIEFKNVVVDFELIGAAILIENCRFTKIPSSSYGLRWGALGGGVRGCTVTGQNTNPTGGILVTSGALGTTIEDNNIEELTDGSSNFVGHGIGFESNWKTNTVGQNRYDKLGTPIKILGDGASSGRQIRIEGGTVGSVNTAMLDANNFGIGRVRKDPYTGIINDSSGRVVGPDSDNRSIEWGASGNKIRREYDSRAFVDLAAGESGTTISTGIGNQVPVSVIGVQSWNNSADAGISIDSWDWDESASEVVVTVSNTSGSNPFSAYLYFGTLTFQP